MISRKTGKNPSRPVPPEMNPDLNGPIVAYLGSEQAAHVNDACDHGFIPVLKSFEESAVLLPGLVLRNRFEEPDAQHGHECAGKQVAGDHRVAIDSRKANPSRA